MHMSSNVTCFVQLGMGRPVLVIPWVVIQELDALKNNKNTDQLVSLA